MPKRSPSSLRRCLGWACAIGVVALLLGFAPHFHLPRTEVGSNIQSRVEGRVLVAHAAQPATPTTAAATQVAVVATAQPTVADRCAQAEVAGATRVSLREAPGLATQVITTLATGTDVDVLCDVPVAADNISWLHVRTAQLDGWMSSAYLLAVSGE